MHCSHSPVFAQFHTYLRGHESHLKIRSDRIVLHCESVQVLYMVLARAANHSLRTAQIKQRNILLTFLALSKIL